MATRKLISKNINADSTQYIGDDGELWVDTDTNKIKISDGATAGGVDLVGVGGGGGGATAWADITNISNANGPTSVVIGQNAGGAGTNAVAIGLNAGETTQGNSTVAIGDMAGETTQSQHAVAIGALAGQTTQGESSVAIGKQAGKVNQGSSAVAIGNLAGVNNQHNNSIVIAASGSELETAQAGQFMVKPVRAVAGALPAGFKQVAYNPTTGEFISYG